MIVHAVKHGLNTVSIDAGLSLVCFTQIDYTSPLSDLLIMPFHYFNGLGTDLAFSFVILVVVLLKRLKQTARLIS